MSLARLLGVRHRELASFVGAGGKSTLLLGLGNELARAGHRVVLTTTTKFGNEEISGAVCRSSGEVEAALAGVGPVFLLSDGQEGKASGFPPGDIDRLFAATTADYVLVEADGARRHPIKAPAGHEPAIPGAATLVVVVAGLDALSQTVAVAAHRPERVAALTGLGQDDVLTPRDVAKLLGHAEGGLKGVPPQARVVVALTKAMPALRAAAADIAARLADNSRIDRVVTVPRREAG